MTKTWLITGAGTGLGPELAAAVLDDGDNLVATDPRPDLLHHLAGSDRARVLGLDVADPTSATFAVRTALEEFGGLDVVAAHAGAAESAPIEETPLDRFRAQVDATLFGVVHVVRAALPVFRAQRGGHFLPIAPAGSRAGGTAGLGAYQAATAAVEGFAEVLHHEVAPLGVRVTIVQPGAFRSDADGGLPRLAEVGADYEATVGRWQRSRRAHAGAEPGDPARAARVLVDLVASERPPLRLLLGSDAVRLAERSARARAQEADVWADVSRSTDVADGRGGGPASVLRLLAPAG
jgi:NAD(P)-dependent dehydrogenase (short-subunit alcohol dehydrogenase family)